MKRCWRQEEEGEKRGPRTSQIVQLEIFYSFRLYPNVSYSFRVFCLTRISIFNGCNSRRLPATTSIVRMRTFEKSSKTMKMQFRLVYFWVNTCKTSNPNQQNKQVQHSTCLHVLSTSSVVANVYRRNVSFSNGWDEKLMTLILISDRKRKT